ncbi:MAG: hypothetical protein NTY36_01730 [Deltaproteobacteria bacterium]|nr:hypothetical protein [Deltaproteobacteria bacterium]
METGFREEVFNVILAQILEEHGVISAPERIIKARPGMTRKMPDVLVYFRGLRLIIEGKVEDAPNAEESALSAARQRVEDGLAHIGVAVVYPALLRKLEKLEQLKRGLKESHLRVAIYSESGESGFTLANIEELTHMLYQTFDKLVQEDVVKRATEILSEAVEKAAPVLAAIPGFPDEAAKILGIRAFPARKKKKVGEKEDE